MPLRMYLAVAAFVTALIGLGGYARGFDGRTIALRETWAVAALAGWFFVSQLSDPVLRFGRTAENRRAVRNTAVGLVVFSAWAVLAALVVSYSEDCPGCRPAILDVTTGPPQPLPYSDPRMLVVNGIWEAATFGERRAFHRVTCLNSREPRDLAIIAPLIESIRVALANAGAPANAAN